MSFHDRRLVCPVCGGLRAGSKVLYGPDRAEEAYRIASDHMRACAMRQAYISSASNKKDDEDEGE